jgi:hypothetical protein
MVDPGSSPLHPTKKADFKAYRGRRNPTQSMFVKFGEFLDSFTEGGSGRLSGVSLVPRPLFNGINKDLSQPFVGTVTKNRRPRTLHGPAVAATQLLSMAFMQLRRAAAPISTTCGSSQRFSEPNPLCRSWNICTPDPIQPPFSRPYPTRILAESKLDKQGGWLLVMRRTGKRDNYPVSQPEKVCGRRPSKGLFAIPSIGLEHSWASAMFTASWVGR